MNLLWDFFVHSFHLWISMAPYLLLGMLIGGILHGFLKEKFVSTHLGKKGFSAIFKATLFGIPLPLCSCGVIPVAATLRRDGASRGATLAFLTSTPTTGIDSILATYSLLGPIFAFFRPLASFVAGLLVGIIASFGEGKKTKRPLPKAPFTDTFTFKEKIKEVVQYGFEELPRDIGKWLILGILIGAALSAFLPKNLFGIFKGYPLLEFLTVLSVAIPLYVCATGSIPIAAALMSKGISPGAALVFLIAGPATNTVTVGFVYSQFGKKVASLYIGGIAAGSIGLGLLLNGLWGYFGKKVELLTPGGELLPFYFKISCGIFLLAIILWANRSKIKEKGKSKEMDYLFFVPDMTCNHCKLNIEKALKTIEGIEEFQVDLENKLVKVKGNISPESIKEGLEKAGYTSIFKDKTETTEGKICQYE